MIRVNHVECWQLIHGPHTSAEPAPERSYCRSVAPGFDAPGGCHGDHKSSDHAAEYLETASGKSIACCIEYRCDHPQTQEFSRRVSTEKNWSAVSHSC